MKPQKQFATLLFLALLCATVTLCTNTVQAQSGVARGSISAPRDPELEKQSAHNLEVAKYYFYKRKPDKNDKDGWARLNKAVLDRLQEIIDTNPNFARMDSVYFLMGEVYQRNNEPDKAKESWSKVIQEFPDSEHLPDAKKRLGTSVEVDKKDSKPKDSKPEKKG
jgi:outer membrane protein assembly factor BamD (BamD/ComL family)